MVIFGDFFKKYGWIISGTGVLTYHVLIAFGVIAPDNSAFNTIDWLFAFLGLGSVRMALAEYFAGIDMSGFTNWLVGKRTFIISTIGFLLAGAKLFLHFELSPPLLQLLSELLAATGIGTLMLAGKNYRKVAMMQADASAFTKPMKKSLRLKAGSVLSLIALVLLLPNAGSAQGLDNIFSPRPIVVSGGQYGDAVDNSVWGFYANLQFAGTMLRPSPSGTGLEAAFLNAAGPALTYARSYQEDGKNHIRYSFSLFFPLSGTTEQGPALQTGVAGLFGFADGIINIGGGYEVVSPLAPKDRWFALLSFAYYPFLNK